MATVDLDKLKRLLADAGEYPNGNSYNPYLNDLIVAAPALILRVEQAKELVEILRDETAEPQILDLCDEWLGDESLKRNPTRLADDDTICLACRADLHAWCESPSGIHCRCDFCHYIKEPPRKSEHRDHDN